MSLMVKLGVDHFKIQDQKIALKIYAQQVIRALDSFLLLHKILFFILL